MLKFSANVGFLWEELELPERINKAAAAGFDAVECHFPYAWPSEEIASVLKANKLCMVGINTRLNDGSSDTFGIASVPGQEVAARALIDQAIDYASAISAINVNVVAGLTCNNPAAVDTYKENLHYACQQAASRNLTILIEPLNPRSVPAYHFSRVEEAVAIIESVAEPNLKIMFDYFHAQIVQGDLLTLVNTHINHIGHVQISAVHDRGEPDCGEIDYPFVLAQLDRLGYKGFVGAEYKPRGASVELGLGWLSAFRNP